MKTFKELAEASKTFNLGFELEHAIVRPGRPYGESIDSLKLNNHHNPISIGQHEALIVYDNIIQNKLKCGVEIATAFGISSAVIGQAVSSTNGKLVTIDAYVEEYFNNSTEYNLHTHFVKQKEECDGLKMANCLIEHLGLTNNVFTEIGWSPDDVPSIIERHFPDKKLDFAFIDGGHSVEQIAADVNVLIPYLEDDCIFMFHDFKAVGPDTVEFMNTFFSDFKRYDTFFDLAMYSKGNKQLV